MSRQGPGVTKPSHICHPRVIIVIESQSIRQFAALPYRIDVREGGSHIQVLLITSRETGRWVIPKGNPVPGLSSPAAAALEALEEAGIEGRIDQVPVGRFAYEKRRRKSSALANVDVFPLVVEKEHDDWKEKSERMRQWFSAEEAAAAVDEADLAALIRQFAATRPATRPPRRSWWQRTLRRFG